MHTHVAPEWQDTEKRSLEETKTRQKALTNNSNKPFFLQYSNKQKANTNTRTQTHFKLYIHSREREGEKTYHIIWTMETEVDFCKTGNHKNAQLWRSKSN